MHGDGKAYGCSGPTWRSPGATSCSHSDGSTRDAAYEPADVMGTGGTTGHAFWRRSCGAPVDTITG